MGKFVSGALLASLVWGAAWWLLIAQAEPESAAPCDDRCGPGTTCEDDLCVAVAAPEEAEPEAKGKRPRRRKGARKRGSAAGGDEGDVEAGDGASARPQVDDRNIPQFSADEPQTIDLKAGSERLSDAQVNAAMRTLTPRFQSCIADAASGGGELRGTVKISARVGGDGKVLSVSASAPAAIRESGAIPCIRKAVYDHRFPSRDGPAMAVDLRFDVD
ncbi:MAG: hypothetical protein H6711_06110 [Myxococcales bacterium]|nr:hypothetical protein [Myxococcales bacterium]